jgi:anti-sigma regulatory factor (Ser/Thr protein kinase)
MEIAVGELLSNVHRHAYPSTTGPVFVEVFHTYRTVTVIIIDKGRVTAAPRIPATLPDQNGVTGRGLYLVQRLADELQLAVNHRGHGLCVRATKWFKPPRHGAARWRGHVTAHVKHSRRRRSA